MSTEIEKSQTRELDGFGGFTDAIEGGEGGKGQLLSGVSLLGLKLKYLDPLWTDPDEQEVKTTLVAHNVERKVQKWLDNTRPVATIMLTPGQPWPDIEKMNAACPETEWREKFGKKQGPWQGEHNVLFFDPNTMVRYWWPSPITTAGSAICVRELVAQTKLMRSFKGVHVYPLVELSHTFFPTNYGGRERPSLVVKDWMRFGEGGNLVLPAATTPPLTGSNSVTPPNTPTPATPSNPLGMQSAGKLTAKEVTGDEIRY
jgi:hypothetical protein